MTLRCGRPRAEASRFTAQLVDSSPSGLRLGAGQLRVGHGGLGVRAPARPAPALLGPSFELVPPAHGVEPFDGTAPQAEYLCAEVSRHEIEEHESLAGPRRTAAFGSARAFGHRLTAERVTWNCQPISHLHRHRRGVEMLVFSDDSWIS